MVTEMTMPRLSGSQNKTKGHDWGKIVIGNEGIGGVRQDWR